MVNAFDASGLPWRYGAAAWNAEGLESASQVYQAWLKSMMAINAETAQFVVRRLQEDIRLPMDLVRCRDPKEIVQTQADFFRTMADDYSRQSVRVGCILNENFHAIDRPETLGSEKPSSEGKRVSRPGKLAA